MNNGKPYDYDIIILGAGIGGAMLGAILARNGAKVLIIDSTAHPRFSVGESTIPYTLVCLRTISERYDVPEIKHICSFDAYNKHVGSGSGIKKHFGFMIHKEGKEPDLSEVSQFNTPKILHDSSHYFRQDVDAYLFFHAVRYGCDARQNCMVKEVAINSDGVVVSGTRGEEFRSRYVVDGSGYRSPLATAFGLREEPCRFFHHSRSLFTHMIDVQKTDDVIAHLDGPKPPLPWYTGTMHHMFDGGWFWVIPFNNHKLSLNPLVSVGLTIDPRRFPKSNDITPEKEFEDFAARFPAVDRVFRGAKTVRPWVSTDRLQYSSNRSIGDRFCLLPHAAGFIDPLFSRGMSNTVEVINALSWRLLEAVKDDDFSAERFEYVERLQQSLLDYNDNLVNSAFISFRDYNLWNAVFKIWAFGSMYGTYRLQDAITTFRRTGSQEPFLAQEEPANLGLMWPEHPGFKQLYDTMVNLCLQVEAGTTTGQAAADQIFAKLKSADYIAHPMGFSDPDVKFLHPSPLKMAQTVLWALRAPPDLRRVFLRVFYEVGKAVAKRDRLF